MKIVQFVAIAVVLATLHSHTAEDPAQKLKELESQISKAPDNPMLFYRKSQCLMTLGKRNEGYGVAKDAMALFVKEGDNLAWMMLEQIDLGHIRVDVHFNMGPRERKPPEMGIIRPLSFRIWRKGKDEQDIGELLEVIDFEIGVFNGKPSTAALGQMAGEGHANFGILDTASTYDQIRERLIDLVRERQKGTK
ncbi:MAG: hypothetical protein PHO37_16345 [Kiritimatiellae bacterium]|nr:hypothetical protein [Kiritimatiellia bacterium]